MDPVTATSTTVRLIADNGALVFIAAIALGFIAYYLFKLYPEDRKFNRQQQTTVAEQVALSRAALETANFVITKNTEEMKLSRESDRDLNRRMLCVEGALVGVEGALKEHDKRAEAIAKDVAIIKAVNE